MAAQLPIDFLLLPLLSAIYYKARLQLDPMTIGFKHRFKRTRFPQAVRVNRWFQLKMSFCVNILKNSLGNFCLTGMLKLNAKI
jgi:hypothetical protein